MRAGVNPATSLAVLRRRVAAKGGGASVVSVQRPAEIVNYKSMGSTPAVLGGALAVAAVSALALTLIASVRRRRRDLALLKTLGFTRRQLAAAVAWQSTIAVGVGILFGIPIGTVTGRSLWDLFAHELHVVADPSVPALTILFVAIGALVLANVVAAVPGRQAARTPAALALQAE
jgi:ABC-type lipoprotein release transport system permease subunit